MAMKGILSVIVPIYNIESYIKRCIDSIINQSMKEIEIILVDDGSTDSSGRICDAYALHDNRIHVIHQDNKGLSDARNAGMNISTGEYIMFVDGDDWVDKEFCRFPYEIAERNNADIVIFQYDNGKEENITEYAENPIISLSKDQAVRYIYQKRLGMVWNKLYKKTLVQNIRFISGRFYEDGPFTTDVIQSMNNVIVTDKKLYHWCYREDSITKTGSKKVSDDYFEMSRITADRLFEMGYLKEAKWSRLEYSWIYLLRYGCKAKYATESISYLLNQNEPPEFIKWKGRLMFRVLRFSPGLFGFISVLFGKRMKMVS